MGEGIDASGSRQSVYKVNKPPKMKVTRSTAPAFMVNAIHLQRAMPRAMEQHSLLS